MPTLLKRINASFRPEVYDLITRLAKIQRKSRSAILTELVDEVAPILERVVTVTEAAATVQDEAKESLRKGMERAEKELLPHAEKALSQYDLFIADLARSHGGKGGGAAAKTAAAPPYLQLQRARPAKKGRKALKAKKRGRKR